MLRRSIVCFLTCLAILPMSIGCGGDSPPPAANIAAEQSPTDTPDPKSPPVEPVELEANDATTVTPAIPPVREEPDPEVIIKTSQGDIRVRLFQKKAPVTVDNFLTNYVDRGFYEETIVHYVDKGFMLAAGGYLADFSPKEPRAYILNEADNGLKNLRGTLAMARDPKHADSATSQFYINLADNASLDHVDRESAENFGYCVFGEVVEGLDVVDKIANVPVTDKDPFPKTPTDPVVIKSVTRVRNQ